ncbi:hypothetical protein RPMA_13860 [Tardiphaga alba]|uniref:MFS transporter n=1 Tax=Tardiphaga alba TaxID=340268 RepID=A0ABX8A7U5_9BRAD|nr:hypothetical protein [Tardiphaga alba]QUS39803.1 hypothetical protein RPMA_13860 [Tardiphaga alba]
MSSVQMRLSEIEQIKHQASGLNSFAVAIATAGSLGPLFAFMTDRLSERIPFWSLIGLAIACLLVAYIIHETGRSLLEEIR